MGNHGWGIREMIIYMCVLVIILLFVAISINSLYKRIDKDVNDAKNNTPVVVETQEEEKPAVEPVEEQPRTVDYDYYHQLEDKVNKATYKYLEENPTIVENGILKLDSDTLINLGFLSPIYNDLGKEKCTAYSNVYSQSETEYVVKSFVRCDNYISQGY